VDSVAASVASRGGAQVAGDCCSTHTEQLHRLRYVWLLPWWASLLQEPTRQSCKNLATVLCAGVSGAIRGDGALCRRCYHGRCYNSRSHMLQMSAVVATEGNMP
jgi:hypothetical protein